jgi:hypothetical protein
MEDRGDAPYILTGDFRHVDADINGKFPVEILPKPRDVTGPGRVEPPHLEIDDMSESIRGFAVAGSRPHAKTAFFEEGPKPRLQFVHFLC